MPSAQDDTDKPDDPIVRRTLVQLRLSVIAVVCGIVASILLAGVVAAMAYNDGVSAARQSPEVPQKSGATSPQTSSGARGTVVSNSTTSQRRTKTGAKSPELIPTAKRKQAEREAAAARETASSGRPEESTYVVLLVGCIGIGLFMYVAVRRPYGSAYENAVELAHAYRTLQEGSLETYAALNATVEAKDRYTAGHGLRVTLVSLLIGQELGLSEADLDTLRHAATFHDIGKIAVPDRVLQKEGKLTPTEFEAMKIHPVESARICSKFAPLRDAIPAIRSHHERMDGRGYPDGLVADEIPIGARIIAVADTWDAITSDRPYRRGQAATVALDEIRRVAGKQLDENVVRAFLEVLAKDPWMFGLTPLDIRRIPSAPGQFIEMPSMAAEDLTEGIRGLISSEQGTVQPDIDWSRGFDEDDLAA